MTDELWTIEQLPDRVAEALAENYGGQQNGRVRELPNGRTIRWYTTIGLVDRPAASRGRNALYSRRHVLQLAAVKQLQAAGRSLAEIQQVLLGATNTKLAEIARVKMDVVHPPAPISIEPPFWHRRPHDDSVNKLVFGVRVGDSVTVVLDTATRTPNVAEIAEIEAAAGPLLEVIDRLGLSPRKESR